MDHQNYIKPGKVYAGITVVAVGFYAFHYVKTVREERAKRRKIAADLQKSLGAVSGAYSRVVTRLEAGHYDGPNMLINMMTDLEFEQIVEFNKE